MRGLQAGCLGEEDAGAGGGIEGSFGVGGVGGKDACRGGDFSEEINHLSVAIFDIDCGADLPANFLKCVCMFRTFQKCGKVLEVVFVVEVAEGGESTFLHGEEVLLFFVFGVSVRPRLAMDSMALVSERTEVSPSPRLI